MVGRGFIQSYRNKIGGFLSRLHVPTLKMVYTQGQSVVGYRAVRRSTNNSQELGLRAAISSAGMLTSYAFGSVRNFPYPFCCSLNVDTPVMGCWHSRDNGGCIGHSNMEMVCILTLKYAYLFYCGTYHFQAVLYRRGGYSFDRTPVDVSLSYCLNHQGFY